MYELCEAIIKNEKDNIDKLLPNEFLSLKEADGITPVAIASIKGDAELITRLIDLGAPFKKPMESGVLAGLSPLEIAIFCKKTEVVQVLLQKGADVNRIINDTNFLNKSNITSDLILRYLNLMKKFNIEVHKIEKIENWTPIFLAIWINFSENVETLIQHGANLETEIEFEKFRFTPHLFALVLDPQIEEAKPTNKKIATLLVKEISNPKQIIKSTIYAGATLLYLVVYQGITEGVEHLINLGADVNESNPEGSLKDYVPLFTAAAFGFIDIVKILVTAGADINFVLAENHGGDSGNNHFMAAVCNNHLDVVKFFIENLKIDFKIPLARGSRKGHTPIYAAVGEGAFSVARYLIEKGVDCISPLTDGELAKRTPLDAAAKSGDIKCADLLMRNGASFKEVTKFEDGFTTPLIIAYNDKHYELCKFFLKTDEDINVPLKTANKLPLLHTLLTFNLYDLTKFVLENARDKIDINALVSYKRSEKSALTIAMDNDLEDIVILLLQYCAEININFLISAITINPSIKIVSWLINNNILTVKKSYSISGKADENLLNLLALAILSGKLSMVKFFVDKGAKVNGQIFASDYKYRLTIYRESNVIDKLNIHGGMTPVFLAASCGYADIVAFLITNGAMVNKNIKRGKYIRSTALHIAAQKNHPETVKVLIKKKANPLALDKDQETPMQKAIEHPEIAELLQSYEEQYVEQQKKIQKPSTDSKPKRPTVSGNRSEISKQKQQEFETSKAQHFSFDDYTIQDQQAEVAEIKIKAKLEIEKQQRKSNKKVARQSSSSRKESPSNSKHEIFTSKKASEISDDKNEKVMSSSDFITAAITAPLAEKEKNIIPSYSTYQDPVHIYRKNQLEIVASENTSIETSKGLEHHRHHFEQEIYLIENMIHYSKLVVSVLSYYNYKIRALDLKPDSSQNSVAFFKKLLQYGLAWSFMKFFECCYQYHKLLIGKQESTNALIGIDKFEIARNLRNYTRYLFDEITFEDLYEFANLYQNEICAPIKQLRNSVSLHKIIRLDKLEFSNLYINLNKKFLDLCNKNNTGKLELHSMKISYEQFNFRRDRIIEDVKQFEISMNSADEKDCHLSACNFAIDCLGRLYNALSSTDRDNFKQQDRWTLFIPINKCYKLHCELGHKFCEIKSVGNNYKFVECIEPLKTARFVKEITTYSSFRKNSEEQNMLSLKNPLPDQNMKSEIPDHLEELRWNQFRQ